MANPRIFRKLLAAALLCWAHAHAYTWPDPRIDVAEDAMYDITTSQGVGFVLRSFVSPCSTALVPISGTNDAAEWLRTAFHDMATADVAAGTGGLDASIGWETLRAENVGMAFNNTLIVFRQFQSARLSMADVIALGTRVAVQACTAGRVVIPVKAGRIDSTGPGAAGVPEPQQNLSDHTAAFKRLGFNVSDMVAMVACGHTVGGVHGSDFPEIVPHNPTQGNNESVQGFDDTIHVFDNHVATGFTANSTQNALAFGPNETTRSDFRIFTHPEDGGGNMIRRMAASQDFFFDTCQDILGRMLDVVPKGVQLTEPVAPIRVKPSITGMFLNEGNKTVQITGQIRILEDGSSSRNRTVTVHASPRISGNCSSSGATSNLATCGATQSNLPQASIQEVVDGYPALTWYTLDLSVPISEGMSSFTVQINEGDKSVIEENGGSGFPVHDLLFPVIIPSARGSPATCQSSRPSGANDGTGLFTLSAQVAVRDDLADASDLEIVGLSPIPNREPVQRYEELRAPMTRLHGPNWANTGYSVYNANVTASWNPAQSLGNGQRHFDVVAKRKEGTEVVKSEFWSWHDLPRCR